MIVEEQVASDGDGRLPVLVAFALFVSEFKFTAMRATDCKGPVPNCEKELDALSFPFWRRPCPGF
jgi:hypothetical protein